jgi:hypothetical protein
MCRLGLPFVWLSGLPGELNITEHWPLAVFRAKLGSCVCKCMIWHNLCVRLGLPFVTVSCQVPGELNITAGFLFKIGFMCVHMHDTAYV